jgi:hypothetical protein
MSSFVSAAVMAVLGPSWWAAQVGGAILGAAIAPLAWAVSRAAARVGGLDARRVAAAALAAGILAACLGPLVLGAAVPDSYTPFTVFTVAAALLVPRALGVAGGSAEAIDRRLSPGTEATPSLAAGFGLGLALGLAYLSRQEAVWMGLTVLLMLAWARRRRPASTRLRASLLALWPIVVGGLLVVTPWLLRNLDAFGSAFPGQAVENMFLVRNEDIFAFLDRPNAARYLDQGLATVATNPLAAAWSSVFEVLLLAAFPVGLAGLLSVIGLRRSPALREPGLTSLLVSGAITFGTTVLLFPVATRWGTFLHASGPLLVALIVTAVLGTDALMARISTLRGWQRPNVILGPIALLVVAALLGALQLGLLSRQAGERQRQVEAVVATLSEVAAELGVDIPSAVITDHPMWLADALGRDALALPDEEVASIMRLSHTFAAPWVVIVDGRGRHPAALLDEDARECLLDDPQPLAVPGAEAWLFRLADACPTA